MQQLLDQLVIKAKPGFIYLASPRRQNPRPTDRKAISPQTQFCHQGDVFAKPVIMVSRDIAVASSKGFARKLGKEVPYRGPFPISVPSPLDLIGGRSCTPKKIFWKTKSFHK